MIEGKQVREVNWPIGTLLTEIKRGERVLVPNGDTIIKLGDTLLLNVPNDQLSKIRQKMSELDGAD